MGTVSPLVFDPPFASAYSYHLDFGPNFATVEVPDTVNLSQTTFTLSFNGFVETLTKGTVFDFTAFVPGGITDFIISGIIPDGLKDPNGGNEFFTSITFVDGGQGQFTQTPISDNPEPGSLTLMGLGAVGLIGWHRRRAKRAA